MLVPSAALAAAAFGVALASPAAGPIHRCAPEGNLASVTGPDQKVRRYHYEQSPRKGLLTGITDENGVRWATYRYDYRDRVVEESQAGGANRTTLAYEGDLRTVVTDALGIVRTYDFVKVFEAKRLRKVTEPCTTGCGVAAGVIGYACDTPGITKKNGRSRARFKLWPLGEIPMVETAESRGRVHRPPPGFVAQL